MKFKLGIFNLALVIYLIGLLCAIGVEIRFGAIIVIAASLIIAGLYINELAHAVKAKRLMSLNILMYSLGVLVLAEIFIQGFSIAIDKSLYNLPGFIRFHVFFGFILASLFIVYSILSAQRVEYRKFRLILFAG
jgi:hypothetical protein